MSRFRRITWQHLKGDGTVYEMTADLCGQHSDRVRSRRIVVEDLPAPKVAGRQRCNFCAGDLPRRVREVKGSAR